VGVFLLGGAAIAIGYVSRRYLAGLIQYVQPAQQLLTDVKQDIFDVAVAEEVNPEHTKGMENTHRAIMPYLGETTCGYFAVFDGHNGVEVAEMSARYLHEKLELQIKEMREVRQGLDKCFEIAYEQMDDGLRICRAECGTAAVTCMLRKESDTAVRLCAANAGDCRAVLCRAGLAFRVTRDHKPDDEDEKRRIEAAKGFVARGRVNSFLSLSRALGNHVYKRWVPATPHYWEGVLGRDDQLLILACDGLWDVVQDQEAVEVALRCTTAQGMCKALLREALKRGSRDNVTILVVRLCWPLLAARGEAAA